MKNSTLSIFPLLLLGLYAQAQVPQAFKYQAVVRDASGQVLTNQQVSLKIDLIGADTAYTEIHDNVTNAFGLVNLEIGRGTVQFGDFSQIDWSQQPLFIQVSLDAAGGSDYQIMGFAELLSVPYALHAANSGLPATPERGDLLYYDGTAWQRLRAGAAGAVLTMGADGLPAWNISIPPLDSLLKVTMANGDTIYVHPEDSSLGVIWGGEGTDIIALANMPNFEAARMDFSGEASTAAIVAQLGDNNGIPYAAKICADLVAFGFDDWYLPAAGELGEMYQKLGPGGSAQMTEDIYWSASERHNHFAWFQGFDFDIMISGSKANSLRCRCVRR
jgi:hypothetical protein